MYSIFSLLCKSILSCFQVVIRGPKDDVENAKKQLLELVEDRKINSYTSEIKAKPEFHKFLIGRGGVNIRKVYR